MTSGVVRATFELEPPGPESAEALAAETHGRVVGEDRGRVVVECPLDNWAGDVTLLVSAVVAGEAMEAAAFTRCRLVGLELPRGLLPGPALGGEPLVVVGAIVKPALRLSPAEVADVAAAHEEVDGVRSSWSLIGGGIGGDNAVEQVDRVGGPGLGGIVLLLGSRAYRHPGGIGGGVAAVVEALGTR